MCRGRLLSAARIAAAAAAVIVAPSYAHAQSSQDEWVRQVRQQLQYQVGMFANEGFRESHDPYVGNLDDDEAENLTVELRAGVEYMISGVCDNDCSDLDLALLSPSGSKLTEDVEMDDVPMMRVTIRQTGTHKIRVSMATCDVDPCRYGVAVFERSAGAQSASAGGGSDEWAAQVRRQIDYQVGLWRDEGFTSSHEPFLGSLDDDEAESLTVELHAGREYMITGVCDNDCSDLDLTVYSPAGSQVAQDIDTDDVPMTRVVAKTTGSYRVSVSMAACSAEPCRYGVAVFGK